jgi:ribonuclease P protein component
MTEAGDQRYRKIDRLRKRKEFLRVQQGGKRFRGKWLTILWKPADVVRFGLTVSKKVGSAPVRSDVKRRLREVYRLHKAFWPAGMEFVVIAKPSAASASYAEMRHDMLKWAASVRPSVETDEEGARAPRDKGASGDELAAPTEENMPSDVRENTPETP